MPETTALIPSTLVVDQTVLLVSNNRRVPELKFITVEKIGRDWITFSNGGRARKAVDYCWTIDAGGYAPHQHVWVSEAAYAEQEERRTVWRTLKKAFEDWSPPDQYTLTELRGMLAVIQP